MREPFNASLTSTDIPPHSGPPETEADTLEERIKRAFDKQQTQLASILSSIDALPVRFVPEFLLKDNQVPIWSDNDSNGREKYDENMITDEAKQMIDDFSVTDYVPAMGGSSVSGSSVSEGNKQGRGADKGVVDDDDMPSIRRSEKVNVDRKINQQSHATDEGREGGGEEDREPTEAELDEQAALLGLSPRHMGGDDGEGGNTADGMNVRLSEKNSLGSLGGGSPGGSLGGSLDGSHVGPRGTKSLKGIVSMDRASGFVQHYEPLLVLSWSNVLLQKGLRIPLAWDKEQKDFFKESESDSDDDNTHGTGRRQPF